MSAHRAGVYTCTSPGSTNTWGLTWIGFPAVGPCGVGSQPSQVLFLRLSRSQYISLSSSVIFISSPIFISVQASPQYINQKAISFCLIPQNSSSIWQKSTCICSAWVSPHGFSFNRSLPDYLFKPSYLPTHSSLCLSLFPLSVSLSSTSSCIFTYLVLFFIFVKVICMSGVYPDTHVLGIETGRVAWKADFHLSAFFSA